MDGSVAIFLLVFAAVVAVAKAGGINGAAFFIFCFVAALIGISWFFHSRRSKPPSALETAAANIWLLIRRLVGFAGALFFVVVAIGNVFLSSEVTLLACIGSAMLFLVLAGFCVWVAIYGQGPHRYELRDDVALHRENKSRYRWRW